MSSKGEDKFSLKKLQSTYADITVKDCSTIPKSTISSSNSVTVTSTTLSGCSNKVANHQLSIGLVATTGDQNIELATHAELKQVADRKSIPPYTSSAPAFSSNHARTLKSKTPVLIDSKAHAIVGKSNESSNLVTKGDKSTQIPISQCKQGEKIANTTTTSKGSDSNLLEPKNIQNQFSQIQPNITSNIIGKNIQKNVLSFTPINVPTSLPSTNTASITTSVSSSGDVKEARIATAVCNIKPSHDVVTSYIKPGQLKEICRPGVRSYGRPRIELHLKSSSQEIPPKNNVPKTPVIVNSTAEVARNIVTKSVVAETVATKNSSPIKARVITKSPTESVESPTRNNSEAPKSTPPRQVTPPVLTRMKHSNPSVSSLPQKTVPQETNQDPPIRITWSDLDEDSSKEFLEKALNSGSDVHVTESVTLSRPSTGVQVYGQSTKNTQIVKTPDPKDKDVSSETVGQLKPKLPSTPISSPGNRRRIGKVTETSDKGTSVSSSSPTIDNSCSSPSADDDAQATSIIISSLIESSDDPETNETPERKQEEPECLTISSDEEGEEVEEFDHVVGSSDTSEVSVSIMNKEPVVNEKSEPSGSPSGDSHQDVCYVFADETMSDSEIEKALDSAGGEGCISLTCRTVRIGSYKVTPRTPVILSKYGLRLVIPAATSSESVVLKIPIQGIQRVLIHFGRALPVIFYYLYPAMGPKVRKMLDMTDPGDAYYDPSSKNDPQKRITLLPEKLSESSKVLFNDIYPHGGFLVELNHKEANELLLRSVPKEARERGHRAMKVPPNPVLTIMVFPPPPAKGGISINTEDYSCLAEDVFLNDVIIDFYLKYVYLRKLSEEDQKSTHIFSSFFYKRLTDKATPMPRHLQNMKTGDSVISAAEIRHNRVKNWTKNIDIFSKDYIIIPLNENQHWFLAIICFPGLKGPVRYSDDTPIETGLKKKKSNKDESEEKKESQDSEKSQTRTIGSTTITPVKVESKEFPFDDDNDAEDRDEAEATDEEVHVNSSEESEDEYMCEDEIKEPQKLKTEREPIKQPCILIFDSLAGASRARIIATLREYLKVEYKVKHGEDRDFSKCIVKGTVPKVPQQDNFTDCGLFVLQYVESFFENKLQDYHIPIRALRDWFHPDDVSKKRYDIQQILLKLMEDQNVDVLSLNLPALNLCEPSDNSDCDYDSGEYADYGYDDYDHMDMDEIGGQYGLVSTEDGYDVEDEDDGEESHYAFMNSDDGGPDSDDTDEDIYRDLDCSEAIQAKNCLRKRRALRRRMENIESCEEEEEEEEEYEPEEGEGYIVDVEEQLSSETEESLENVNRETVSICRLATRSRSTAAAGSNVISSTSPTVSKQTTLTELKSARPFGELDSANEGCSSKKKFKPN